MGEEGSVRSWEEEIYWTHFQSQQFSQLLQSNFYEGLVIPEHFTKNLKRKLPKIVTLKGPSSRTWEVVIASNNDIMFFNHGWGAFVNDHSLQEKDLLIFKYNGDSCFDVLIFDGQTMCEKASSYMVKKCEHREHQGSESLKRKIGEISSEAALPSPDYPIEATTPEKSTNNDIKAVPLRRYTISSKRASSKKARNEVEWIPHVHEEPSVSVEEVDMKADFGPISPGVVHDVPFISSRRLISEEEKQNAVQLALAALTSEGFFVVMKPTHVYRRFYMSIPSGWVSAHLNSFEKQDVILRIKDKQWVTRFCYQKAKKNGGLAGGWKTFAMENRLEEFDVCIFEPAGRIHESMVLDVNIIRVYNEDLVTLVSQASPGMGDQLHV